MYTVVVSKKLKKGQWQQFLKKALGSDVDRVECSYHVRRTVTVSAYNRDNQPVCRFSMSLMPGCYAVLISHGSWVAEKYRGQGFAAKMHELRQRILRDVGASMMIATVREDNKIQNKVMRKVGTKLDTFVNETTDARLALWKVEKK